MNQLTLAIPFGILIGLTLGLVGGGGSIMAVPVLVYVLGEPISAATSESLLIVAITAGVAAKSHARNGHVKTRVALTFSAAGALGAIAGTALNHLANPRLLLTTFSLLLIAAATAMLRLRHDDHKTGATRPQPRGHLKILLAGVTVGVLTGFFGVGGGFIIVPALTLLLDLPMPEAIGTSLLVIALTSTAALAAHATSGHLNWTLALTFTTAATAGALTGTRLGTHIATPRLTQLFALLTLAVGLAILSHSVAVTV